MDESGDEGTDGRADERIDLLIDVYSALLVQCIYILSNHSNILYFAKGLVLFYGMDVCFVLFCFCSAMIRAHRFYFPGGSVGSVRWEEILLGEWFMI